MKLIREKKMELLYQQLSKESEFCINLLEVDLPYFTVPWHYHSEIEIIYIERSNGFRFVGDHSEAFEEGDIGLIGSNLPHVWKSDKLYQNNTAEIHARALVIHFQDTIFKGNLALLPEMDDINRLLLNAQYGIKFTGSAREQIAKSIKRLIKTTGLNKIVSLIELLDYMSKTNDKQLLASNGYTKIRKSTDFDRFDKAHRYMIDNFQQDISLDLISGIANMTPTSFCRYFKKRTTKSYLTFLNEIRIGHACKLLLENKMNIAEICYDSGFNNLSNFNLTFKKVKGSSPSLYIKNLRA